MAPLLTRLTPMRWVQRSRRTARLRLTFLYAGTFLVLGTTLIAAIFLLASTASPLHVPAGTAQVASPVPSTGVGPSGMSVSPLERTAAPYPGALRGAVVSQRSSDLARLLSVSWLVLAITAAASAAFGWYASGRVLRPMRAMTVTARTISAGNLGERLALSGPDDEFKRLGDTLDDLLARLQASFEAQRRFVANASHELRTPLAVERTLLQVALADPDATAETLRAACEEVLAAGHDHERLLEALLTLASSERGLDQLERVDLAAIADRAVAAARRVADRHTVELVAALAPASAAGDPALVDRLVSNLVDNAVRYNRPGGRVDVRVTPTVDRALLTVSNTGPGVAEAELARLFEPFQRLGPSRGSEADGHFGLGLSIVHAIAAAHRATLTAEPRPDGGLCVAVSFPSRDPAATIAPHGSRRAGRVSRSSA